MPISLKSNLIPFIAFIGIAGALPLSAELLFHEGFDYAPGSLNETGDWTATGNHNIEGSVTNWNNDNFVGVAQTGIFAGGNNGQASIPLDSSVTDTFTAGSTTWLSWLSINVDSRHPVVAIGTGTFGDRAQTASGQNIGGGSAHNSGNLNPTFWDPVNSTGADQLGGNVAIPTSTVPTRLLMAKIVWAADGSDDTVTLAAFASGTTISEAAFDALVTSGDATSIGSDLNQATFDTLNVATSRVNYFDEIRIATTFDEAVTGTTGSDYDTWALAYPGLGLPGDDDDQDGLTNDDERIFGLNPQSGASVNPYVIPFDPATGIFSYTRRTQLLTGLDYPVWFSTDLGEWYRDINSTQTAGTPANDIEIVDVGIDPALLDEPRLFVRLSPEFQVTLPAPELSSIHGSNRSITLNFTEELYQLTAWDVSNYTVELEGGGAVTVTEASLSSDNKTVTLTLGSDLAIASSYDVVFSNLTGTTGVPIAGGNTGQFQTWDNDPNGNGIRVFILAGQSNMVGHGKTESGRNPAWTPENGEPKDIPGGLGCLRYLAVNDASYPDVDYSGLLVDPSQPATSAWATRSDVKVWWKDGYVTDPRTVRKGDLGIGYADSGSWFGPEYAFGRVMGDHFTNPVLIIKTSWGGIDLAQGFRPPSAVADRGGEVGPYYKAILDDVREALGNLATQFPAAQHPEFAAVGYRYRIVGFGWHQGWNDGGSAAFANEYEENLADLIDDLRAEFSQPALPVAIANSGFGGVGGQTGSRLTVRQAQDTIGSLVAPHPVYSGTVLTGDTAPYWRDASVSPSSFGFHWNHNAESYFLIGKGMGEDMEALLP